MRRALLTVVVALLVVPAGASAATTIGSDLSQTSDTRGYCTGDDPGASCTVLQLTLGTTDLAVPADGVITGWATRDAGGAIALRVIDGPAGQRRVVAAGPTVQASGSGVQRFDAQIAVTAGQRVGVELATDGHVPFRYRDEVTTGEEYLPPLTDVPAAPAAGAALERTYELFYNVTLEPDADRDGLGDESQDADHGGAGACPTAGVLARGSDSVVARQGRRIVACRFGALTRIGTRSSRTQFRLFQLNDDQLALVKVVRGASTIQIFDLGDRRRTFSTTRTHDGRGSWRVTDLVVAPNGDAAWIATLRGRSDKTSVWVRHGRRVQQIDQGRIRPTSLTLSDDNSGVNYTGADGRGRNSGFG